MCAVCLKKKRTEKDDKGIITNEHFMLVVKARSFQGLEINSHTCITRFKQAPKC